MDYTIFMRKSVFANNYVYHVYNRGVDKRKIFLKKCDYLRFIHNLFEFNDIQPVTPTNVRFSLRTPATATLECLEVQPLNIKPSQPRKILVEILAFCLMPNHYHLLLRQKRDNGIVKFMQKLGTGYTMYFNQKEKRVGSLFQGRFKAISLQHEPHLIYLPHYIHLNPLDLMQATWREEKVTSVNKALQFLKEYRWSSFPDYIGNKNFPSITQRKFLTDIIGDSKKYQASIKQWILDKQLEDIEDILLEDI